MRLQTSLPWYGKVGAKLLLARLPAGYALWRRLGLFRHGAMDRPSYALQVFRTHFGRANFANKGRGFVGLELGPGDSLFSALIAYAHGATHCYLIDTGQYAEDSVPPYREMVAALRAEALRTPSIDAVDTIQEILQATGATYGTDGLAALRRIPDRSVDFVWSQAVLEHIRRRDFSAVMTELRRILRTDGVCSHRVDLQDHLGGQLNNLRFPEWFWEDEVVARSGFYTNRLRFEEMLGLFREAGFAPDVITVERWPALPTPRKKLAKRFRDMSDEELRVSAFDVILTPA
jgi:SAM-dependent methyltransferase